MSADGPGNEKKPLRPISDAELMAGIHHIMGIYPIPYHQELKNDMLRCGTDQNIRAIPPEIRGMARTTIRYRDRKGWPSLLPSSPEDNTQSGL